MAEVVGTVGGAAQTVLEPASRSLRNKRRFPARLRNRRQTDTREATGTAGKLDRHRPLPAVMAAKRWNKARAAELLTVPYVHVVFTLRVSCPTKTCR